MEKEDAVFEREDQKLTKEGDWRQMTLFARGTALEHYVGHSVPYALTIANSLRSKGGKELREGAQNMRNLVQFQGCYHL